MIGNVINPVNLVLDGPSLGWVARAGMKRGLTGSHCRAPLHSI